MDIELRHLWLTLNNSMINNEKSLLEYRNLLNELDTALDKDWKIFHDNLTKESKVNLIKANVVEFVADIAGLKQILSKDLSQGLRTRQAAAAAGRKRVEGLRALIQNRKQNLEPVAQMIQQTRRMGNKISHQMSGRKGGFTAWYNKYGKDVARRRLNDTNLAIARALTDDTVSSSPPGWLTDRETRNRINLSTSDAALEELMATAEQMTLRLQNLWDNPSFENLAASILAALDILDPFTWLQKLSRVGFSAQEAMYDDAGVAYAKAHARAKNDLHTELRQVEKELAEVQAFRLMTETTTSSPWSK